MRYRRLTRIEGPRLMLPALVGAAFLWVGCSGEQYEKPEDRKPAEEPAAEAPAPEAPPPTGAPEVEPEPPAPAVEAEPTMAPEPTEVPEEPQPAEAPAPEPAEEVAAVEAPSDLVLLGVVRAGASPSALIGYQGSQEVFRKGDPVFGQGTVTEVRESSVVIRTESGNVTLNLPAPDAAPEPTPEPAVVESSAPPESPPPPPPVAKFIARGDAQGAMRNFSGVLSAADARRVAVGGSHGIQLDRVDPESFLARLGLKSGDILQKINGIPLTDPARMPDLSAAANGREIAVTFVREEIGLTFSRPLR